MDDLGSQLNWHYSHSRQHSATRCDLGSRLISSSGPATRINLSAENSVRHASFAKNAKCQRRAAIGLTARSEVFPGYCIVRPADAISSFWALWRCRQIALLDLVAIHLGIVSHQISGLNRCLRYLDSSLFVAEAAQYRMLRGGWIRDTARPGSASCWRDPHGVGSILGSTRLLSAGTR